MNGGQASLQQGNGGGGQVGSVIWSLVWSPSLVKQTCNCRHAPLRKRSRTVVLSVLMRDTLRVMGGCDRGFLFS